MAASYAGDHRAANHHLMRAQELHETAAPGNTAAGFRVASYLAIDAYRRSSWEEAATHYRSALELAEAHGLDDQVALAALNAGTVSHQLGRWADALQLYNRGRKAAIAIDRRAPLTFNIAMLYFDIGAMQRALDTTRRAKKSADEGGYGLLLAASQSLEADICSAMGEHTTALALLDEAESGFAAQNAVREIGETIVGRANVLLAMGRTGEAAQGLDRLPPDPEESVELSAGLCRARLLLKRDAAAEAKSLLEPMLQERLPIRATALALLGQAWRALDGASNAQRCTALSRQLWEEVAADLPAALRDAFWQHPDRRGLDAPAGLTPPGETSAKLTRLLAINRRMSSTLDTDEVLRMAMDAAVELVGAERGFLLLQGDSGLDVVVARNLDREHVGRSHTKFSRTIAEEVMATGEAIVTIDARSDRRFSENESVHAMKLRSVLAVPIPSPDGVQGALYLDNRFQNARFEESDADLLAAFADQLSIALRNASLMRELKQRTALLEEQRAQIEQLSRGQAAQIDQLVAQVAAQRQSMERRYDYGNLVGRSPAMRAVLDTLDRVIESPLSILIGGESGTGKELIAHAVHAQSSRRDGPFVAVNCGALPDNLLESELFGHKKGAFTGAERDRKGLMESADGGTLFLDELGEMSLAMQVKLLRALETREVRPVGGATSLPVDFRLVCATNRNLEQQVEDGSFREDLFYRVGVVQVQLPALRQRLEDFPELIERLLQRVGSELNTEPPDIDPMAIRLLMAYEWPGNVRQLLNVLRSAAVFGEGRIGPEHISLPSSPQESMSAGRPDRYRIEHALARNGGRAVAAAKDLGISRATLYRWMKNLGISRGRR